LEPTSDLHHRAPELKETFNLLADQTVPPFLNKYSNIEIVEKATKILAGIDNHVDKDCPHCRQLLEEIYKIAK